MSNAEVEEFITSNGVDPSSNIMNDNDTTNTTKLIIIDNNTSGGN